MASADANAPTIQPEARCVCSNRKPVRGSLKTCEFSIRYHGSVGQTGSAMPARPDVVAPPRISNTTVKQIRIVAKIGTLR